MQSWSQSVKQKNSVVLLQYLTDDSFKHPSAKIHVIIIYDHFIAKHKSLSPIMILNKEEAAGILVLENIIKRRWSLKFLLFIFFILTLILRFSCMLKIKEIKGNKIKTERKETHKEWQQKD